MRNRKLKLIILRLRLLIVNLKIALFTKKNSLKVLPTEPKKSPPSLTEISQNLPIYEIPRSLTIKSDGTVVKSLFLDYVPDRDYLLSKILQRSQVEFEKEKKENECLLAGSKGKSAAKKPLLYSPFSSYN